MSARIRREIAYWFMLLIGTVINGFQAYSYVTNQLQYTYEELIVLVIGVVLNFAPRMVLDFADKLIKK